ncbi:MAG: hypothetical protein Q8L81_10980 [Bacteroidota bacterium]|nr:hypothetical protein [Bacteroidota bacterium]
MGHTSVKHEKYEPKIVATILLLLTNAQKINQPRLFEVYVNDLAVVPKTDDIAQLDDYQDYINEETTIIKIFVYHYNQKSSDKFFLHISPESLQEAKNRELSGITPVRTENDLREKWEKDKDYEALKEENTELRAQIDINEKALAKAAKENRMIRERMDVKFKDRVSMFLDGIVQSEFVKKNFPGAEVLKDFVKKESEGNLSGDDNDEEVLEEEEIEEINQRTLTIEEEKHLLLLKDIKAKVGTTHLASIMYLLDLFATNPNSIESAIKVVKNYIARKPQTVPDIETDAE